MKKQLDRQLIEEYGGFAFVNLRDVQAKQSPRRKISNY